MKSPTLSRAELLAELDRAENQKPTRLLVQIGRHLASRRSLKTAAMLGNALAATGWREQVLSPPSEALPPLA